MLQAYWQENNACQSDLALLDATPFRNAPWFKRSEPSVLGWDASAFLCGLIAHAAP